MDSMDSMDKSVVQDLNKAAILDGSFVETYIVRAEIEEAIQNPDTDPFVRQQLIVRRNYRERERDRKASRRKSEQEIRQRNHQYTVECQQRTDQYQKDIASIVWPKYGV